MDEMFAAREPINYMMNFDHVSTVYRLSMEVVRAQMSR